MCIGRHLAAVKICGKFFLTRKIAVGLYDL
jgi:hypothetical protein